MRSGCVSGFDTSLQLKEHRGQSRRPHHRICAQKVTMVRAVAGRIRANLYPGSA